MLVPGAIRRLVHTAIPITKIETIRIGFWDRNDKGSTKICGDLCTARALLLKISAKSNDLNSRLESIENSIILK